MATHGRGLICLALTPERADLLKLHPQAVENTAPFGTAFTVSIDAARDITTGISAADRATTIQTAVDPHCKASDLARPGHVFPLRAHQGGVLKRAGQTEGSVDLARMAGLSPAGVICEIMNEDGTMARVPELLAFFKTSWFTGHYNQRFNRISVCARKHLSNTSLMPSSRLFSENLKQPYLRTNWTLVLILPSSKAVLMNPRRLSVFIQAA